MMNEALILVIVVGLAALFYKELQDKKQKKLQIKFEEYTVETDGTAWDDDTRTILNYLDLVGETEKEITLKLKSTKPTGE